MSTLLIPNLIVTLSGNDQAMATTTYELSYKRTINLFSVVNAEIAEPIISELYSLDDISHQDIVLRINSPGGSVSDGLAIIDAINYIQSDVITVCTGMAASMAAIVKNGIHSVPNHYVIDIPTEEEQDCFLYEFSTLMYNNELRQFHGLDRWLYFKLDGSQAQLDVIKGIIMSSAVYDNYFEGLLAFDASELLMPTNKKSRDSFIRMISSRDYSRHATIVVFFKDFKSLSVKGFLSELGKQLDFRVIEYSRIR